MSDPAPPDGPPSDPAVRPRWWRRPGARWTVAAVTIVLIAGVATAVVLGRGGSGLDLPTASDPVPASGPPIMNHLPSCGVSAGTVAALVPHAEVRGDGTAGDCEWESTDREHPRSLDVTVEIVTSRTVLRTVGLLHHINRASPTSGAISTYAQSVRQEMTKTVRGLGDEAAADYTTRHEEGTARIVFRVRNVVVTTTYGGYDGERFLGSAKPLSEKTTLDGALRAAIETAKGLDAPPRSTPTITERAPERTQARHVTEPCATVPEKVVHELVGEEARTRSTEPSTSDEPARTASCTWQGDERTLAVGIRSVTGATAGPPDGRHAYLRLYVDARAAKPVSKTDEKYFSALRRPGEQAFAAYVRNSLPGRVVFRVGDTVVQVAYAESSDEKPLTKTQALNGAYTVAVQVAESLHG